MSTIKAANIQNPSAASAAIVLDTSGNFSVPAGTVSAPGIQAPSDSNTGIFFPAADTIAFAEGGTEAMRIDSSSRLLVGTSSSRNDFFNGTTTVAGGIQLELSASDNLNRFMSFTSNNSDTGGACLVFGKSRGTSANSKTIVQADDGLAQLSFHGADGSDMVEAARIVAQVDGTPGANDMPGRLVFSTTADGASSPTERMRITQAGYLLHGCTSVPSNTVKGFSISPDLVSIDHHRSSSGNQTSNMTHIGFYNGNGIVGSITTNGSATAYGTSSDYRLKENVEPLQDSIVRFQQLKPSRFNFIADPSVVVDGFIAHEVQEVVPEAISGEKDAVDENGSPIYQSIDQSKLVPLLTAALQEAIGEIESLKARLTAAGI